MEETNLTPPEVPLQPSGAPQIIINNTIPPKKNGLGTAGFVLSLLGLLFCWIPFLNILLWILGLIFSIIGVTRMPKGLSIAGIVLSAVTLIVFIICFIVALSMYDEFYSLPLPAY